MARYPRSGSISSTEPRSQHFLRRPDIARDLAMRLHAPRRSLVLEPGPGRGAITRALLERGFRVLAVEKDAALARALPARLASRDLFCCDGDILDLPLPREPYSVVSNVPFSITAALMRRLLDAPHPPQEALLIVQREAAERFAGVPRATRVSLAAQPWFTFAIERRYDHYDFDPPPPVDCVLLRIERRRQPLLPDRRRAEWRAFVEAAFGSRGQEARATLRLLFTERQLVRFTRDFGFDRRARPSEVPFGAWLAMFRFHTQGRFGAAPLPGVASLRPLAEHVALGRPQEHRRRHVVGGRVLRPAYDRHRHPRQLAVYQLRRRRQLVDNGHLRDP